MARRAVKFKSELNHFVFQKGKFTKTFDEAAQRLVRMAARAWLRAVIIEIPVWTGFALGSLKFARGLGGNLGKFLNVSIPISPISSRPRFYYHRGGRRTLKTPERGGIYGKYTFPSSQMRYRFNVRSDVVHFVLNEFYAGHSPRAPWRSFEAGRRVFMLYVDLNKMKLPKVVSFITKVPPTNRRL